MNADELKLIRDFLSWLDSETNYEIGEHIYSDYGDGESYINTVSSQALMKEYEDDLK